MWRICWGVTPLTCDERKYRIVSQNLMDTGFHVRWAANLQMGGGNPIILPSFPKRTPWNWKILASGDAPLVSSNVSSTPLLQQIDRQTRTQALFCTLTLISPQTFIQICHCQENNQLSPLKTFSTMHAYIKLCIRSLLDPTWRLRVPFSSVRVACLPPSMTVQLSRVRIVTVNKYPWSSTRW